MEEITLAAIAAYEHFSKDQKRAFKEFFSAMDENGDGKISLQELKSYCLEEQLADWSSYSKFFNLFADQNQDGTLGFDQVLTLFYLRLRGWYLCDGCGVFVSGLFFTCTHCRLSNNDGKSYNLCIPCYRRRKFKHKHKEFLDNHSVLLKMRMMPLPPPSTEEHKTKESSASGTKSRKESRASRTGSRREKLKGAFEACAAALTVVTAGVAMWTQTEPSEQSEQT